MCGEVRIITNTTTLHVVGGKVGLMTHESNIVSLAPYIGSYGPNLCKFVNMLNLHVTVTHIPLSCVL